MVVRSVLAHYVTFGVSYEVCQAGGVHRTELSYIVCHVIIVFDVVHCSPAAGMTSTEPFEDEFTMFDEDISVKMPLSISSVIRGLTGERSGSIILETFDHSNPLVLTLDRHCTMCPDTSGPLEYTS